jgi:hypothetical protein
MGRIPFVVGVVNILLVIEDGPSVSYVIGEDGAWNLTISQLLDIS